jgi:phosphoribosylaminoimidazolecarboxamide formyltransferase/IMP cyclohydrolase
MPRALLSVTDKTGLVDFAQGLSKLGYTLLSTGGTATALRAAGLEVTEVSEVTGFPEMLGGRVKTLHPMVHGALLGDVRQASHRAQMAEAGIEAIDLLCVNLYAFEKTVTGEHDFEQAIESIDIGGPAMIRAASKNLANISVVVDPADYEWVLSAIEEGGLEKSRLSLASKAFRHTAMYDSMISRYLTRRAGESPMSENLTIGLRRVQTLRYGENPHQAAALYLDPLATPGVPQAKLLWGKELSYNNVLDADAAWELVADMPANACAIIKHGNPCGASALGSFGESYRDARKTDMEAAFGGIAAFNGVIDLEAAEAMAEKGNFLEVVIGTEFTPEALDVFANRSGWGKDVRLLAAQLPPTTKRLTLRTIGGGALVQESDEEPVPDTWEVVTSVKPSEEMLQAMKFAWTMVRHVKSNAIVVTASNKLLGVGAGQMKRVQSVRLALQQAGESARGAVLASDAFFPFPDSIQTASEAGIAGVIQPGGSKKDGDVIAEAEAKGICMVLTRVRHFRH